MSGGSFNSTTGYRDPTDEGVDFATWTATGSITATSGNANVLVDYIDVPTRQFARLPLYNSANTSQAPCQSYGSDYTVSPAGANSTTYTNFFACVQTPNNKNQEVYLFLRGNADSLTDGPVVVSLSEESELPTLETRVLVRGVLDKAN